MASIAKCHGNGCKIKTNCYRYLAPIGVYTQEWGLWHPDEFGACDGFWKCTDTEQLYRLDKLHRDIITSDHYEREILNNDLDDDGN